MAGKKVEVVEVEVEVEVEVVVVVVVVVVKVVKREAGTMVWLYISDIRINMQPFNRE